MAQSMASDDRTLLRPAEAAQRLGIPASTLRRWSRRFAPFLSPCLHSLPALQQRIDDRRVCQGGGIADVFQITGGDFAQNPAHDFP